MSGNTAIPISLLWCLAKRVLENPLCRPNFHCSITVKAGRCSVPLLVFLVHITLIRPRLVYLLSHLIL